MPRPPRIHVPGGFYHVTLRGNHQRPVFVADGDQRLLNRIVARALTTFETRLHAYCWMTNHLHFLMQVGQQPLAKPMQCIASEFAREMQKKLETTGHFFERRYYARLVDVDSYFLELLRYIHLNPVRARMVTRADQFPWSSHHAYLGSGRDGFVTTGFAMEMFGSDRLAAMRAYRSFIDAGDGDEWHPEQVAEAAKPAQNSFAPRTEYRERETTSLEELIDEACRRFEVRREQLVSSVRDRYVIQVRVWIAHQAVSRYICGLAAVGRALNRDESTLREAIRKYPPEIE